MKIIAHRGLKEYKQNTRKALIEALKKDYIDGIEFDIRITKDKKIVIIHDPIIDLVSDGSGLVKMMTYKKLLKYNFGTKENPQKIMLLDDFLKELNTNKIIIIDIKEELTDLEIVKYLPRIINKYNLNIYLTSFNYNIIKHLTNHKVGLLIGYTINKDKLYNHFDFNIVSSNYANRINKKKETFIFGTDKPINDFNIITDDPYSVYEQVREQFPK